MPPTLKCYFRHHEVCWWIELLSHKFPCPWCMTTIFNFINFSFSDMQFWGNIFIYECKIIVRCQGICCNYKLHYFYRLISPEKKFAVSLLLATITNTECLRLNSSFHEKNLFPQKVFCFYGSKLIKVQELIFWSDKESSSWRLSRQKFRHQGKLWKVEVEVTIRRQLFNIDLTAAWENPYV